MLQQTLNGNWKMREAGDITWVEARVPGSVMSALLLNGRVEKPFWRLNEYEARELFRRDYEFYRDFSVSEELYEKERVELICYGLDTVAEISINDTFLANTDNMHRTWRFQVKSLLRPGANRIKIIFRAPITYIENYKPSEGKTCTYTASGAMSGNQYLRKAHCMFGWDWGAQIPDAGIWRDIDLVGYSEGKIEDVMIMQKHEKDFAELTIHTSLELLTREDFYLEYSLTDPEGITMKYKAKAACSDKSVYSITVNQPKLWWPNGYGEQPLYRLAVTLMTKNIIFDKKEFTIGLRTLTISRDKDTWGSEFAFMVNGVKIFARGADYIPEDTIYPNITPERIAYLIDSCVTANFNCLRIWGGGYYPSDTFYDLCDRKGIIVWQDLMYACNTYELTGKFEENIIAETRDNVTRIRHHACLGLWCGNNEIESAWHQWPDFQSQPAALKADYVKQFEYILPKAVKEADPVTFYWPSSPSSGGCFDDPEDENRGDTHYWAVWHGLKPFMDYRKYFFRFCSEFGFQSFPSIKTVNSFTLEKDRNIFSKVMESHQKNDAANGKMLYYLSENFLYPKDFKSLLYVTQILQGIAIKSGVEHWRRNRGRCMGSLYWQLNDSWPVASWSSIDYYGRWKALHYMAKRFYAPVAGSLKRTDKRIETYIQNETMTDQICHVDIILKKVDFTVLYKNSYELRIPALSAVKAGEEDFTNLIKGMEDRVFAEAVFTQEDCQSSSEVEVFVPFKYLELDNPDIICQVTEDEEKYMISLRAKCLACFVELDFAGSDAIFNDNYFYLTGKEAKKIELKKEDIRGDGVSSAREVFEKLIVRSLRDTY